MIPTADQFGPWVPGLDAAEYRARLKCLRAIAWLSVASAAITTASAIAARAAMGATARVRTVEARVGTIHAAVATSATALMHGKVEEKCHPTDEDQNTGHTTSLPLDILLPSVGLVSLAYRPSVQQIREAVFPSSLIRARKHAMIRPRTTGHLSVPVAASPEADPVSATAPPWQETIGPIIEALTAIVVAVESQPADGPAWKAFQSAIRRNGEEASAAGGADAREAVLRAVADAVPDRSERRESIIAAAWTDSPVWRL